MPDALKRRVQTWARRKEQLLPSGFSMTVVAGFDAMMVVVGSIAALQRPASEWPIVVIAMVIAFSPEIVFFSFDLSGIVNRHEGPTLWAAFMVGTAILLFATPTAITGDFAPLMLTLTVGMVSAITSARGGALAAASAAALLGCAAAMHRLNTPALYLAFVAIGWLVGYLMRTQQDLLIKQGHMQDQLAQHAAADERRRIAREVHDVIAHSLSVTLLHLTGARHALEHDGVDEDSVRALQRAEHLGRQAMADIRRTVGLLDAETMGLTPEPAVTDIPTLVEDFSRAGLNVSLGVNGSLDDISAAAGLALYRIAQESLANVAKHAPDAATRITLTVSRTAATLNVVNELPAAAAERPVEPGRGLHGMTQRIELLGGTINFGPSRGGWSVHASVPSSAHASDPPTRIPAS
ncbi:integral membrane sensor signal transduction histidine kinase [Mycobacterium lentiflavum]|uniref:histidine kinase n=1 Tax=Mycobacterium lentiflavum TaxID=141349 RepID=A0A0E4H116_MYCLN|nr:histidine kinase [Mycobacterium lentiflavum]CQD20401.1 integral membrane sensor signal transduction histidine kinase [Mycobacterium lentiflavum]